jgi:FdhD protein
MSLLERRPGRSVPVMVTALSADRRRSRPDAVVTEEPLEIRVSGPGQEPQSVGVTMRTPGNDFELAVGFLLAEGVLAAVGSLRAVRYCQDPGEAQQYNVVTVESGEPVDLAGRRRQFTISSACGVCGRASVDELVARCGDLAPGPALAAPLVMALPDVLRQRQRVFAETGGLHGAGLFDAAGELLVAREDVGRHNAVDKVVGWAALQGNHPLPEAVLVVSGRIGFEIVQKAALAGIAVVVAVSAPSSLAVDLARRVGMTVVGFVRDGRANVYAGEERIAAGT